MTIQELKQLDLTAFAMQHYGFRDTSKSTKRSPRLSNGSDIIIISVKSEGENTFWSPNADAKGSIIDFVKWQENLADNKTAYHRCAELAGVPLSITPEMAARREEMKKPKIFDPERPKNFIPLQYSKYLSGRGISPQCLQSARFANTILFDKEFNNVVFPHLQNDKIVGYTMKNYNFSGFSTGGQKLLWRSNQFDTDQKLVITEAAIDGLSYAILQHNRNYQDYQASRYVSIDGGFDEHAEKALCDEISKLPLSGLVVGAFDNDEQGHRYGDKIEKLCKQCGRKFEPDYPALKDWNDQLKDIKELSEEEPAPVAAPAVIPQEPAPVATPAVIHQEPAPVATPAAVIHQEPAPVATPAAVIHQEPAPVATPAAVKKRLPAIPLQIQKRIAAQRDQERILSDVVNDFRRLVENMIQTVERQAQKTLAHIHDLTEQTSSLPPLPPQPQEQNHYHATGLTQILMKYAHEEPMRFAHALPYFSWTEPEIEKVLTRMPFFIENDMHVFAQTLIPFDKPMQEKQFFLDVLLSDFAKCATAPSSEYKTMSDFPQVTGYSFCQDRAVCQLIKAALLLYGNTHDVAVSQQKLVIIDRSTDKELAKYQFLSQGFCQKVITSECSNDIFRNIEENCPFRKLLNLHEAKKHGHWDGLFDPNIGDIVEDRYGTYEVKGFALVNEQCDGTWVHCLLAPLNSNFKTGNFDWSPTPLYHLHGKDIKLKQQQTTQTMEKTEQL